ncbi:MAG: phytanoyl-CoA dioxygenase family protein [Rhodospirillales bacterium]|jgi:phytanoyl-CoA hydroxylase|nr:phytanoyl-CoA dioxygenase family protein [Rhodospirillales bacterium]MBT4041799.1 phytanoyl-CoA dioxygenase family protein [Rhodospirillales bacterium]MBT4628471.1 phytanoyl-CoA dioxygenase family protein [Rhodospirillales bacterium]MBT5351075.1 phytanoyl-CoA dioxygenase family protein [Rhodospirillales bacterium]MBT5520721.1 phytanoyl-CoA dioxygenase family protein [Rhodospirillales bacterium]
MAHHLTAEQIEQFNEDGFLAVPSLLDETDLIPLDEEYAAVMDDVAARLFSEGLISDPRRELSFGERYSRLIVEYPELHRFFNVSLPLINTPDKPRDFCMHTGPAAFSLLRNEKILDVVESILGPEISSNPVQQVRLKPPIQMLSPENVEQSNVGITTWHQDTVALLPEADDTSLLTVWVALTEATVENGCLNSIKGSHKLGQVIHCPGVQVASEMFVPDSIIGDQTEVALPVKRGGIVLFNKHNIHCARSNHSTDLRWSFDLRYNCTGQPTGRPAFPGFIARSRANPDSELHDPVQWKRQWDEARDNILNGRYTGPIFDQARWDEYNDAPICA